MNMMKRILLMVVFALPLAACDTNDGGAEQLGEKIDNAADNTRDALDDAADEVSDSAEDACEDMTDENC
ncbi:hypothetical protein [Gilvimarinus chinensis]|uniref:hypothetical protein n=1 Tax=Gilvimarinus chinensis TaxID=396005 RepID=UPI000380B0F4|nr:hypothetical protein [Gilvimarinus chinensis]